jgi:hypothetical protein
LLEAHTKEFCVKTLSLLGLVAIAVSATANAGAINMGTRLISGDVSSFLNRQETGHTGLSSEQLQALAGWLEHHRSGWQGMITEASLEPIQLQVTLKHDDGAITSMCVIAEANGGHYLRVSGPGKWAYQSFGGIFKSWAATRPISDQELAAFENLVGAK